MSSGCKIDRSSDAFEFFVDDDRYTVPTLELVQVRDFDCARQLAAERLHAYIAPSERGGAKGQRTPVAPFSHCSSKARARSATKRALSCARAVRASSGAMAGRFADMRPPIGYDGAIVSEYPLGSDG